MTGEVEIVHVLVGHRQQQLCASVPLQAFRLAQRRDRILIIAGADLQIAQQHGVIGLLWIDREHFLQKVLRFFRTSHHGVGLRQAGEAQDRRGIQAESMIVGIERKAGFGVKASRVAEQEPELWIIRSRLSRALCVDDSLLVVAAFQCGFRCTGQAGVLDIRAPAQLALDWGVCGWLGAACVFVPLSDPTLYVCAKMCPLRKRTIGKKMAVRRRSGRAIKMSPVTRTNTRLRCPHGDERWPSHNVE